VERVQPGQLLKPAPSTEAMFNDPMS